MGCGYAGCFRLLFFSLFCLPFTANAVNGNNGYNHGAGINKVSVHNANMLKSKKKKLDAHVPKINNVACP